MTEMTVEGVLAEVARIASLADDPEVAHGTEDSLYLAVLQHVAATGPADLATLAAAALTANNLDHVRWYA